jgi:DtxR family transcriptional regulator, manganese transport regulator
MRHLGSVKEHEMTGAGGDDKQEPVRQAERFGHVRDAHQRELAEDYVELIADLIEHRGEARVVDLADCLGVTNATVNNAIQRLRRDGLVTSKPYRSIFLTDQGRKLAQSSRERHRVVRDFLIALGVDAETAGADAEGIEHHVSDATLTVFRDYVGKHRRNLRTR